jgi:hypothetical protein
MEEYTPIKEEESAYKKILIYFYRQVNSRLCDFSGQAWNLNPWLPMGLPEETASHLVAVS